MQSNFPKMPFLFSIIFLGLSVSALLYSLRVIDNKNQESKLLEAEWRSEMLRDNKMQSLDKSLRELSDERTELETHFAPSSDIVPFLDKVEGLAREARVKVEITSVFFAKDHSGLSLELKASGTFSSIYKFLLLLENSPYELAFYGMELHRDMVSDIKEKNSLPPEWNSIFKIKLLSFVE